MRAEETVLLLRGAGRVPWSEFLLNPRRLRGSDFLMRWSQGIWSEHRLTQAVNSEGNYYAMAYGPSGVAPDKNVREFELYFERLDKAGLGQIKRPDLLVFRRAERQVVETIVAKLGGIRELPFIPEDNRDIQLLLSRAIMAVECENSLWRAKQMPDYGATLAPQKRLGGRLGLKKTAVLPTIIIKDEDRKPLREWQRRAKVPIHIWHAFFDVAFGIPFDRAEELISGGEIEPFNQVFQAPSGATTTKCIYKIYYLYAYPLALTTREPKLVADSITDKNGHILPYVRFVGGSSKLCPDALQTLKAATRDHA